PFTSVIFLAIGAGAIFQVILVILKWINQEGDKTLSSAAVVSGFVVGMVIMYVTGIIV
ncbi:MAG: divalent cation transporter, partial [Nitrosopumilus sp.]|nr:divalent cation transporter [Nitrosopumilus sp.]